MLKNKTNILFICPYPVGQAPSQRFRFEQYFSRIQTHSLTYEVHSFLSGSTWKILYEPENTMRKVLGVAKGFIKRFWLIPFIGKYDIVFIHREATPFGPPWFEWVVSKVFRKRIIYDFDDAIWLTDIVNKGLIAPKIKFKKKVGLICRWSYKVSCGNTYLIEYAKVFNNNVRLNPTTIDTLDYHNPKRFDKASLRTQEGVSGIVIGWTGSHSTLKYLESIQKTLREIENTNRNVHFLVIADKPPKLRLKNLIFKKWTASNEVSDLMLADIGIMPLPNDEWTKGKCGFKILQYMALEIPSIASNVGINGQIIESGVNGYLCSTESDWLDALNKLISSTELRNKIGKIGRVTVTNHYSLSANSENFLKLFE
ncbi:MAG TPA: glycosyltransferase [Cyclobacteriaceae bacterium]|nr:glycosyltransferase [Cyclobacteriaceae bacterium]